MESEVSEQIGARHQERSVDRSSHRNGYRQRALETQLGKLSIRIPRLREGSYYPSFLEPHCRLHAGLCEIVMEVYQQGISTRKIDDLAQALGIDGISKSSASRMIAALENDIQTFCSRPLGVCRYVFMDARFEKVREHGRIVSKAVLVAVGVTQEGRRELLGFTVASGENTDTWDAFLRSLVARGLTGVQLAISDACAGAAKAIQQVLPGASWQRCTIHLGRNLASAVGHQRRPVHGSPAPCPRPSDFGKTPSQSCKDPRRCRRGYARIYALPFSTLAQDSLNESGRTAQPRNQTTHPRRQHLSQRQKPHPFGRWHPRTLLSDLGRRTLHERRQHAPARRSLRRCVSVRHPSLAAP